MRALGTLIAAATMSLALAAGARAAAPAPPATPATVTGTLTAAGHAGLAGMAVEAIPQGVSTCTAAGGCTSTYTRTGGAFTLSGLAPGSYDIDVVDGLQTVLAHVLDVGPAGGTFTLALSLPAPAVPAGTAAHLSGRALSWLNAERRDAGLPGDVVLNPRWSQECAAHDAYEIAGGTLQAAESPTASGYSLGGAWAGLSSDLAQGNWTAAASPWQDAPVHLLALLAPSLSVTGIDDSPARQCAVTFPGMLRSAPARDTLHTVPAPGARDVPTSELARESPFTPVQFAGLPASRTTGRELFVYLNRAGETGQAPVQITRATLSRAGHRVAVRAVGAQTPTIGRYLAGGIVIPVDRLAARTTYRATVGVRDGARTLTRTWSFTTA